MNRAKSLVAQFTAADLAMVAALPFGGVRVPYTSDTARITRAVEGITGQASLTETGSELACRTRRFLESLEGFLMEQPAFRSPSTVVLFTAGMAAPRRDAAPAPAPGTCELTLNQFRRITAAASAAHANFYVMQPVDIGMNASAWRASDPDRKRRACRRAQVRQGRDRASDPWRDAGSAGDVPVARGRPRHRRAARCG